MQFREEEYSRRKVKEHIYVHFLATIVNGIVVLYRNIEEQIISPKSLLGNGSFRIGSSDEINHDEKS